DVRRSSDATCAAARRGSGRAPSMRPRAVAIRATRRRSHGRHLATRPGDRPLTQRAIAAMGLPRPLRVRLEPPPRSSTLPLRAASKPRRSKCRRPIGPDLAWVPSAEQGWVAASAGSKRRKETRPIRIATVVCLVLFLALVADAASRADVTRAQYLNVAEDGIDR